MGCRKRNGAKIVAENGEKPTNKLLFAWGRRRVGSTHAELPTTVAGACVERWTGRVLDTCLCAGCVRAQHALVDPSPTAPFTFLPQIFHIFTILPLANLFIYCSALDVFIYYVILYMKLNVQWSIYLIN